LPKQQKLAFNKMLALGLIYEEKDRNQYKLTTNGFEALELGSYRLWKENERKSTGNVYTNSTVIEGSGNQLATFSDSTQNTVSFSKEEKEVVQENFYTKNKKEIWVTIFISLIIGIVLLAIEYGVFSN
jgi:hypothetical protein